MQPLSLKVLAAAVSAALGLAACGDDNRSERATARSGADNARNSANTPPAGATAGQNANNPTTTSGVTTGTNPTPTGQSGATMSGNIASNASPGSPGGGTASSTPSTTPPSSTSPSANGPMSDQTRAGSPPTTGSSPAAGAAGPSSGVAAATGAAGSATAAAGKTPGDASKNAVGTTEKRFMTSAASGGMLEVEAGRVVAQQGSNAAVRQLAERLVRDHETANAELKALAAAKNVQIPGEMSGQDRAMVDKLRKMQGNELDRAYVEQVGRAHHRKDIQEFERAARESNDADVRTFAQKQLPILREHYEMAQQAAKQVASSK
jgi:putative membrane protein